MACTALAQRSSLAGASLVSQRPSARKSVSTVVVAATKKLNVSDPNWSKGIGSLGYLLEDKEKASPNVFKQLEKKKILSSVESLGLLSAAEKAGLSLSKIESMGLLSTAERLGALSFAEELLVSDPGKITSASLPFIVAGIASLSLIPHDNGLEAALSYGLGATFLAVAGALFIGGFVVKGLQDE